MKLEIKNKYELLALHKIFLEAKYNGSPEDYTIQSSPLVRDIYERVFELLLEDEKANPPRTISKNPETWNDWRQLGKHSHRIEHLKARLALIDSSTWCNMPQSNKQEYIELLACPLLAEQEQITELISYANELHENH